MAFPDILITHPDIMITKKSGANEPANLPPLLGVTFVGPNHDATISLVGPEAERLWNQLMNLVPDQEKK